MCELRNVRNTLTNLFGFQCDIVLDVWNTHTYKGHICRMKLDEFIKYRREFDRMELRGEILLIINILITHK